MHRAALILPLFLIACGPPTPEQIERQCRDRAYDAEAPRGNVGVGINSKGSVGVGIELGASLDYLRGRDPEEVYQRCMLRRTGEPPLTPLYPETEARR